VSILWYNIFILVYFMGDAVKVFTLNIKSLYILFPLEWAVVALDLSSLVLDIGALLGGRLATHLYFEGTGVIVD
jgi:hypothetical protein